jgi:hypothetical protein
LEGDAGITERKPSRNDVYNEGIATGGAPFMPV